MIIYQIIHLQEVNSTNTYLKKLATDGNVNEGTVILADYQSAGRGRGENIWLSDSKVNLTFSLLLRPAIQAIHHFYLNEFVSLAIVDTLLEYGITASIKWPNDIYIGDKKVAGMLIENSIIRDKIITSIVGIGLNINQVEFSYDVPNATSIRQLLGKPLELSAIMDRLLECINLRYSRLMMNDFEATHIEYNNHLYKRGELVQYRSKTKTSKGTLHKVNEDGELMIGTDDGKYLSFLFDEVQLMI